MPVRVKSKVYELQNKVIHTARAELERMGVLQPGKSLEACRFMAGKINLGIQSISSLSLTQRSTLIDMLIDMGATVRNPRIYTSDLSAESAAKSGRIVGFSIPNENQLRMVDALADQVKWHERDGYLRFCHRIIKAPRPRNSREVTTLKLALKSLIEQQAPADSQTPVETPSVSGI